MFKIGQKVVCVNPNDGLIKGKTYDVIDCLYCRTCNKQSIDIGYGPWRDYHTGTQCNICCVHLCDGLRVFCHTRFRPLEYTTCHDELIEKFKSPEEVPDTKIKEPVK